MKNHWAWSASIGGALLAVAMATGVEAAPITYFSYARQFQGTGSTYCFTTDFQSSSASVGTSCNSAAATSNADASAKIADAKVAADASLTKTSGTAADFPGDTSDMAHAEAIIGDSFRAFTTGGSPFTWSGDMVTFSLSIDGAISAFSTNFTNNSWLQLIILNPGALDIFANFQQTGAGYSDWQAEVIDEFSWGLGSNFPFATTEGNVSTFPDVLTADFTPGGDFDWAVWLITDVTATNAAIGSGSVDFFHTVNVSYTGPDGVVTRSASGLFPGTAPLSTAVPEPATLTLFGLGVLALASIRRRKRKA